MKKSYLPILITLFSWLNLHGQVRSKSNSKKNFVIKSENKRLVIPNKKLRFPKKIIVFDKNSETGKPYNYNSKKSRYSPKGSSTKSSTKTIKIKNGEAIFRFKKNAIKDRIGSDMYLISKNELFDLTVYVSKNRKNWVEAGVFTPEAPYIDLFNLQNEDYTFVKLKNASLSNNVVEISKLAVVKARKGEIGITRRIKENELFTKNDRVLLKLYDFGKPDFDRVSVSMNEKLIDGNKLLARKSQFITLNLQPGENIVAITAINEGYITPNTVDIKVVDGFFINIGRFRIKKGKKKVFTIHKL